MSGFAGSFFAAQPHEHDEVWGGALRIESGGLRLLLAGEPWLRDGPAFGSVEFADAVIQALLSDRERALERLHGEFALAAFYSSTNTALLAIDRFGIQSLCYSHKRDGELLFATSPRALQLRLGRDAAIDPQALYHFIYFHVVPSPLCIFRGVVKLGPAELTLVRGTNIEARRYWAPVFDESSRSDVATLSAGLLPAIQTAVDRCKPDYATGSFLSGGLDSSTVTGCLNKSLNGRASAVSIGFGTAGYDELAYARAAARHFGIKLIEYQVTADDVARVIPRIAREYGEPFGNSSAVPTFLCAAVAREHGITHMLAGDGGDEIFGGNSRYATQKLLAFYQRLPRGLRERILEPLLLRSALGARRSPLYKLRRYIEQARVPMPARMQSWNLIESMGPQCVFAPDYLGSHPIDARRPLHDLAQVYDSAPARSIVNRMLFLDWKLTLADNDLRKVSVMCESAGVRVSYPLLDPRVVDLSTLVPPQQKVRGMKLRYFYRSAMKGFLPKTTLRKSKHGFGLPFGEWLRTSPHLRTLVYDAISDLARRSIFDVRFMEGVLASHAREHAGYYGSTLWLLCILELWLKEYRLNP
jgi:asparagine synthase (glutamine-hydrolysing)